MKEVWWRGQGSGTKTFRKKVMCQYLSTALAARLQERVVEYSHHDILVLSHHVHSNKRSHIRGGECA